jgi:hypothetical protein
VTERLTAFTRRHGGKNAIFATSAKSLIDWQTSLLDQIFSLPAWENSLFSSIRELSRKLLI